MISFVFFFNDTATTEIYTLSLHDALPISGAGPVARLKEERMHRLEHGEDLLRSERIAKAERAARVAQAQHHGALEIFGRGDRKSTRLNSSHGYISYAVFCLKKKKKT